jgi:hypothetical protein
MEKRLVVLDQDAYEMLNEFVKSLAAELLLLPEDRKDPTAVRCAQSLISSTRNALPMELTSLPVAGAGRFSLVNHYGGSDEAKREVMSRMATLAASGQTYDMSLNVTDFADLMDMLYTTAGGDNEEMAEWAREFLGDIAHTLRVELI